LTVVLKVGAPFLAHFARSGALPQLHRNVHPPLSFLSRQYEHLAKKGSAKALEELKKVQMLKKQLIDRMPGLT